MLYLTKILKTSWAIAVTQVKTKKKKFLFDDDQYTPTQFLYRLFLHLMDFSIYQYKICVCIEN